MRKDWNNLEPKLQAAMDAATASGEEDKCQLAIYHHGKLVISLFSGGDIDRRSLFPVFSCGKSVAATLCAILVQEGILSYDLPIREVWPEFACHGKEEMRFWHFLSHRAGLAALPVELCSPEMADWGLMCRRLAEAIPGSPADQAQGSKDNYAAARAAVGGRQVYHGLTFGWLVGEVLQRVTGKPFPALLQEKILEPLGLGGDIVYGSDDETDKRFVPVDDSRFESPDFCALGMNPPVFRHQCIPSFTCLTCAEALARHYAALIGEVDGVRLLSPAILDKATTLCRAADDPVEPIDRWDKFGLGYSLMGTPAEWGSLFGHGGACGSEGMAFKHEDVAMAFTKNKTLPSHPVHKIRDTISDILEIPHRIW